MKMKNIHIPDAKALTSVVVFNTNPYLGNPLPINNFDVAFCNTYI